MALTSHQMLSKAANLVAPLGSKVVFVGGTTVHLHVDDPTASPVRATKDVDLLVQAITYVKFTEVESKLRDLGFEQVVGEGEPICRWSNEDLTFDVLPTKPEILGFSQSRWLEPGYQSSVSISLDDGTEIEVLDVLHLCAAKIEAFEDRGSGDLLGSHDFEDIVTLLDGCTSIWTKLALDSEVARFVAAWLAAQSQVDLEDAIAGHVGSYARANLIIEKLEALQVDQ